MKCLHYELMLKLRLLQDSTHSIIYCCNYKIAKCMFAGICYELNDTISNSQVPSSVKQMSGRFVERLSKGEVRFLSP